MIFAGGGLWLTLALYLARLGLKVAVIERGRAGSGHREWNISGPELAPLTRSGLFTPDEVSALIVARYRGGVCRWHGAGCGRCRGCSITPSMARRTCKKSGKKPKNPGSCCSMATRSTAVGSGPAAVQVQGRGRDGARVTLVGRALVDALGASSPHARVDLGCPTVGGALEGLARGSGPDEVDPDMGDILVTTEHREEGRQHIWEGFPGRAGP